MNIVLLGAPGAGKGTQAKILSDKLSLPIISTGNIIRDALKSGSELGEKAKSFVDAGKLLPDNIVIDIVKERLKQQDCESLRRQVELLQSNLIEVLSDSDEKISTELQEIQVSSNR